MLNNERLLPTSVNWNFNSDGFNGFYPLIGVNPFIPVGPHHSGEVSGTAVTLTPIDNSNQVLIQAINSDARYTLDGSTPTASRGFQIKADDSPIIISFGRSTILKVIGEDNGLELQYQWGR